MAQSELETLAVSWNRLAMDHLRVSHFETALGLLRRAEEELRLAGDLPNKQKLQAITLNNLGCFYKRTKRPTIALHYLRRALEVESEPPVDYATLAGTHLNICAIRSGLGTHDKALEHAKKAIRLLVSSATASPNTNSTLVIAYHNAGIEFDFLQQSAEAIESYMLGYELARQTLGLNHPLTETLKQCCEGERRPGKENGESREGKRPGTNRDGVRSVYAQQLPRISTAPRRKRHHNPPFTTDIPRVLEMSRHTNNSNTSTDTHHTAETDLLVGGRVRYITGDRMRPMHKEGWVRGMSRDTGRPVPPSVLHEGKSFRTKVFERKNLASTPIQSSPPLSPSLSPETEARLQAISSRLLKLQSALHAFEALSQATKQATLLPVYDEDMRRAAAVEIQRRVKGFLVRKRVEKRRKEERRNREKVVPVAPVEAKGTVYQRKGRKNQAAEESFQTIYSGLRTYLARKGYHRAQAAAVIIQKHLRRYQCRRLYLYICEAVLCLQAGVRSWLQRRRRISAVAGLYVS